ncbi:hypothetical protein ASG35_19460 [Burkholderia sp. Leaf177]|nr:hypothetical protein ASG35_19460 [Burkholderia sp. Leaf177]
MQVRMFQAPLHMKNLCCPRNGTRPRVGSNRLEQGFNRSTFASLPLPCKAGRLKRMRSPSPDTGQRKWHVEDAPNAASATDG